MTAPIPLFRPVFRTEETLIAIRECLEAGWTGLGFKTLEFERAWCDYTGLPHAHFLNSATAGLHLAVRILKEVDQWEDGDEIITTPLTFVSTNHAILYERLHPVFADVDASLCLDPDSILQRMTARTRAVLFVGMGGNAGKLREVAAICHERRLRLILDAAHMAGTRINRVHVGREADAAVFSFQAVKNLPTADAGMICFQESSLDRIARQLSWLGIDKDTYRRTQEKAGYQWMYEVDRVGFKYHGNSIMAAIGLVALRHLDRDNAYRRQLAAWYNERICRSSAITIIPVPSECESSRHLYQVMVPDRNTVLATLNASQIYPGVHYRDNTEYTMYRYADGTCPVARHYSQQLLSLPMYVDMTLDSVNRVCEALIDSIKGARNV